MKTLILVDLQNDFVTGGSLAVPDGEAVVSVANRLMVDYELVIATQDWHPANHGSFASQNDGIKIGDLFELNGLEQVAWPDHCVHGTTGAAFVDQLNVDGIDAIIQKGTDPRIDSYSGFFDNGKRKATGLAELLRKNKVAELDVLGLATDYCVKFTALDSVELGFRTRLLLSGCRGVELSPGDIDWAIEEMKLAGVEII